MRGIKLYSARPELIPKIADSNVVNVYLSLPEIEPAILMVEIEGEKGRILRFGVRHERDRLPDAIAVINEMIGEKETRFGRYRNAKAEQRKRDAL